MQHFSYFAKAYAAALYSGLIYLMANIAPEATKLSDISLLVWIGFAAAILGSFGVTAVVTNGPKPTKETPQNADGSYTVTELPSRAPATFPAAAVDYARLAAERAPIKVTLPTPEPVPVPESPAPEVPLAEAPVETPA